MRSQLHICCPCGRQVLAGGLCATCYTLKRQDAAYFGGLREDVLRRDNHRCRVCGLAHGLAVHHRQPGVSRMDLMLTLCFGHHAFIHRTRLLRGAHPELLVKLWREQHPKAHQQLPLALA